MAEPTRRAKFTRVMRLSGNRAFDGVYARRCRKSLGPIAVLGAPNELPHHRLGLSVGRRVGHAVTRHRIKRLLREAFRLDHQDWPTLPGGGLDLVVVVYRHEALPLVDYRRLLGVGVLAVAKRLKREADAAA